MPGFNPTFKIQGNVYHRIGALLPDANQIPKFAQLYFHDTDHETNNRMRHNQHLIPDYLQTLQECLHSINPYVQSLKTVIEYTTTHPEIKMILDAKNDQQGSTSDGIIYQLPVRLQ